MSEMRERYAEAIDSVLADEFLANAVTDAVMSVVEADRVSALREAADDLSGRLAGFPAAGKHTRAGWAVAALRDRADEIEATR